MIPLNKRQIKSKKIRKPKTNIENAFQSFSKIQQVQTFSNIQNMRYLQPNNQIVSHTNTNTNSNLNYKDFKEMDIQNNPKQYLFNNKSNRHQRNKDFNNYIPYKTSSSYSYENITDNSFPQIQNNTYTQRNIETYEIPLARNYCLNQQFWNKIKDRANNSMDITYYKPIIYINKNENNSFCKKSDNSDFFTQNNSFFMNGTNLEDNLNLQNNNLNNTINYNKEKYYRQKNIISSINAIPKPQKFRKKIPPIPIKKINESNSNSFYFEENEINNNMNYFIKSNKIKNGFNTDKNKLDSTNLKTKTNQKIIKSSNKKYSNKTYSLGYIKNIEKIGIQLSFSNNKLRNESIDLISPEILKNLKQYSSEKQGRDIIYSDLNMDKIKEFDNYEKIVENKVYNVEEDYEAMRKKYYNKLSNYLLKNKKRRQSQKNVKKEKYNIIDIKEKIKEEKRNRSLSNLFKYKKKEIIKESPSATNIKKQDDIGGKIDLKIQSKNNKRYSMKKGVKRRIILTNLIKQCKITKEPQDKGEIIINAAKIIQKWWRDLISKIFIILNIIKIQSIYRSYITRKKLKQNKNNNKSIFSKKIKNLIYKKIISKGQTINGIKKYSNTKKSRNTNNLENIISNNSFKIISKEDIYSPIKAELEKPLLIIGKNNLKLCFYTKEYSRNYEDKNIIFIQKSIKNYLNKIKEHKNKKIITIPMIPLSFIGKTRYKIIINNSPIIIKPINNICLFTKNYIFLKKKKPIIYSVSKINYESIAVKNETSQLLKYDTNNKGQTLKENIKEEIIINNNIVSFEGIYKLPMINNICYINKQYIKMNDNMKEKVNMIQKKYKNLIGKRKKDLQKRFKKIVIPVSFISKEFKDNIVFLNKISLIQKKFRNFKIKRKIKENDFILEGNSKQNLTNSAIKNKINDLLSEKYFIKYAINKLRNAVKTSKRNNFIKMFSQRIKKIINQFVYQKLKTNDSKLIKQIKIKSQNSNEIKEYKNKNILISNDDFGFFENIFFFNTIKRHIKMNEIDNNLYSDNEIVKLLKESIPEYFKNYPKMNYIPYIKKDNEKNLINQQIYLFDDEKLANYIYKFYQIEKKFLNLSPDIIKKRLILEPLKNQNLFTITRYMDNLYYEYMKDNVCKNCYCKINELCLSGCKCHNLNKLIFNNHTNKNDNMNINDNLIINSTINEESNNRNCKEIRNEEYQRFDDGNSFNSNINDIKKSNTFTKNNLLIQNDFNDTYDKNSINTEYNKNNKHRRINNFIRNFALRKKIRNTTISNLSNISQHNEETLNLNFNLNNNINDKSSEKINLTTIDYIDQSNVYEEDIKLENSGKKINLSLLKKKMKTIEPIPNHIRSLMRMASKFRKYRKESRKKQKETIKLRDSFANNLDYEYYENI